MKRGSGVLLHISSLPGKYGIGTFGKEARAFADFLKDAGQSFWQVLPLCPTSFGDSPYQSPSAFALNPYFIDFELLKEDGLLEIKDYRDFYSGHNSNHVDYNYLFVNHQQVLKIAFQNVGKEPHPSLERFKQANQSWLDDYALFMALQKHFCYVGWQNWPLQIKFRKQTALEYYKEILQEEILYFQFIQYIANKQWFSLKSYINQQGIQIIGDLPIYVAPDSADTWSNAQEGIFKYDEKLNPLSVAGCPPDYFSQDGQYWGNIVYNWEKHKENEYQWWLNRIKLSLTTFDWVRIDHFRGFESYWEIPYGAETSAYGSWKPGPGMDFINTIKSTLGEVNIIAEDLGFMTEDAKDFFKESGFPGMKVLQFAFDSDSKNHYLPHNYDKNCVVYTGTHDNDTILGWFKHANEEAVKFAERYFNLNIKEGFHWGMIRGALASTANLAIIPMQDLLGLGSHARINIPSTLGGLNWKWRLPSVGCASEELAARLANLTQLYGR